MMGHAYFKPLLGLLKQNKTHFFFFFLSHPFYSVSCHLDLHSSVQVLCLLTQEQNKGHSLQEYLCLTKVCILFVFLTYTHKYREQSKIYGAMRKLEGEDTLETYICTHLNSKLKDSLHLPFL